MAFLVGTDEAGYGPNLGPLVVSASAWHVPDEDAGVDLYERLAGTVVRAPRDASDTRVAIAASKRLYSPGGGLGPLERGLLAALAVLNTRPARWSEVFEALDADWSGQRRDVPWQADYDEPLPVDAAPHAIESAADTLKRAFAAAGVRLVALASRVVFPAQFNRLVDRFDSKGGALSHVTFGLLADCLGSLAEGPVRVICDKHGGRDRYGPLLVEYLCDGWVETLAESRAESRYRYGPPERRVEIAFRAKGESWLPAALASMASKYLRELSMRAFNAYWSARVEGLRPTAGYPQDARRFRADVAAAQAAAGIADDVLWRRR